MPAPFQASSLEALTRTTSLRSQPPEALEARTMAERQAFVKALKALTRSGPLLSSESRAG